ncbi:MULTISPECIES: hypothetical protein [Aquimarina]|nr:MULTISPECIES: hypothetical protein [Aquimarina]
MQEGYFINGELMTGKKYTYFNGPNYAIGIDSYRNGKYLGKNWK